MSQSIEVTQDGLSARMRMKMREREWCGGRLPNLMRGVRDVVVFSTVAQNVTKYLDSVQNATEELGNHTFRQKKKKRRERERETKTEREWGKKKRETSIWAL